MSGTPDKKDIKTKLADDPDGGDIDESSSSSRGGGGGEKNLTLLVKDQSNSEVAFKVKSKTPFFRIVNAYCKRQGIDSRYIRFHDEEGARIDIAKTIEELDFEVVTDEEGSKIYISAFLEQLGGGGGSDQPFFSVE